MEDGPPYAELTGRPEPDCCEVIGATDPDWLVLLMPLALLDE
jgi:hypothetical protein